ncbi:hypothetical protein BN1232_04190 [Mycobacterium lentiflavum]|uniref:Uncharacterized protein n=1 Tax=Mycobacterium lentiflavum TaxID=141349 RepID=A0A0E4CPK0_MYCLN|nr:hypothetical protein BN1232_04190 [Mycobacterium lentiflavum]
MVPGGVVGPGLGQQLGLEQLPRLAWRPVGAAWKSVGPWAGVGTARTAAATAAVGTAAASWMAPLIASIPTTAPCRHKFGRARLSRVTQQTSTPSAAYTSLDRARLRGSALALVASKRFATYA